MALLHLFSSSRHNYESQFKVEKVANCGILSFHSTSEKLKQYGGEYPADVRQDREAIDMSRRPYRRWTV